ncbi:MAG: type II toxin-antitoxin system antitoxin SocA domain-containing protein [Lactococcus raffinolactis]|uniref:DUF4065 domain-containing protein n=1 Tax=Pseudolactococcus raffinolactis TaxID=1366 RepID=A0A6H0U9P4_9LACT|nr:type II toxin-antitoxin system antitoxin SocA domain-containing protein [Lactococcus raffinolactis]QIW52851.1 DUF4065 domain-containing protein [Lactococcus raffinolactis]
MRMKINFWKKIINVLYWYNRENKRMEYCNVFDVAATIINYSKENKKQITNLQLQKFLYYIQREYININNQLLFEEEFCAWNYGPVIYPVWKEYAKNSRYPIMDIESGSTIQDIDKKIVIECQTEKLLQENIWDLVDKTHEEFPWKTAKDNDEDIIKNEYLFEGYVH